MRKFKDKKGVVSQARRTSEDMLSQRPPDNEGPILALSSLSHSPLPPPLPLRSNTLPTASGYRQHIGFGQQ